VSEARRSASDLARRERVPSDPSEFNSWANHEAEEAKLFIHTASCCRGKAKREAAQDAAIEHAAAIMVAAAETGHPISRWAYRVLADVRAEAGDRFPELGLVAKQRGDVYEVSFKNPRRSGRGSYPWEQCMSDAFKRYGDEETARRVCGAIRARSMAQKNPGGSQAFPVGGKGGPGFTKDGKPKLVEIDYERSQYWQPQAYGPSSSVIVSDGLELETGAGTSDDLSVYQWGNEYIVLAVNRPLEYASIYVFTRDGGKVGGDYIDEFDIPDRLGKRGLDLKEKTIVRKMMEGLPY
jgi:hypothetical protein